jgi:TolB protein
MNPDGTDSAPLTDARRPAFAPAWSPDGSKIAFGRAMASGPEEIFTMSSDGTAVTRLTDNDRADSWPAWSADGRRIAFVQSAGDRGRYRIVSVRSDGTGGHHVVARNAADPDWSPDGTRIAFDRDGQIMTMRPRGRDVRPVTTAGGFEPSWSPNGRWIAFEDEWDIFKIRPDGTGLTQLTSTPIHEEWPAWSPNGRRIVYLRSRSNEELGFSMGAIWEMRADGSGQELIIRRESGDAQVPLDTPDRQPV